MARNTTYGPPHVLPTAEFLVYREVLDTYNAAVQQLLKSQTSRSEVKSRTRTEFN